MLPIKFKLISTLPVRSKIIWKEELCDTGWYHKYIDQPTSEWPARWVHIKRSQFTGRLDKDWEEVYEWDLIQTIDSVFEVKYDEEKTAFILVNDKGTSYLSNFEEIQVIGNIYENPIIK